MIEPHVAGASPDDRMMSGADAVEPPSTGFLGGERAQQVLGRELKGGGNGFHIARGEVETSLHNVRGEAVFSRKGRAERGAAHVQAAQVERHTRR